MWEEACDRVRRSVHVIYGEVDVDVEGETLRTTVPQGSCFHIGEGHFITNQHVLDAGGRPGIGLHDPVTLATEFLGIEWTGGSGDLDLAVVRVSTNWTPPVASFAPSDYEPVMGTPVALLGFPLPQPLGTTREYTDVRVTRRLSAGFLSGQDYPLSLPGDRVSIPHYELNLLSYPGSSGGPLIDLHGRVLGVNRAGLGYVNTVAAYGYAIRNHEILPFLESLSLKFSVDG